MGGKRSKLKEQRECRVIVREKTKTGEDLAVR